MVIPVASRWKMGEVNDLVGPALVQITSADDDHLRKRIRRAEQEYGHAFCRSFGSRFVHAFQIICIIEHEIAGRLVPWEIAGNRAATGEAGTQPSTTLSPAANGDRDNEVEKLDQGR